MTNLTLRGYYQQLKESNPQIEFRNKVIADTGVSRSMFYNYVMNRHPVPTIYQDAFAKASGIDKKELFPVLTYHEKSKS